MQTSMRANVETIGVYMSVTEIRRSWGTMIQYVKSGYPVLVLKQSKHIATFEPHTS
jgi:hypothetical protein